MPAAVASRIAEVGCFVVAAAFLVLCAAAYWQTAWSFWLVLAVPAAIVIAVAILNGLHGVALLLAVRRRWTPRGIRCLVVYSDSPKWREHVESRWLSRMGSIAATLNWSERQARPRTLESRLFHHSPKSLVSMLPVALSWSPMRSAGSPQASG